MPFVAETSGTHMSSWSAEQVTALKKVASIGKRVGYKDFDVLRNTPKAAVESIENNEEGWFLNATSCKHMESLAGLLIEDFVKALSPVSEQKDKTQGNDANTWTAPIQTFEGEVTDIAEDKKSMDVILRDKSGGLANHSANIELKWVPEQDRDLVKTGAIFYLILYKETNRRTVRNAEEIRFRRLPNWTKFQINQVAKEVDLFSAVIAK